jgi:hypothetical protein
MGMIRVADWECTEVVLEDIESDDYTYNWHNAGESEVQPSPCIVVPATK